MKSHLGKLYIEPGMCRILGEDMESWTEIIYSAGFSDEGSHENLNSFYFCTCNN